MHNKCRAIIFLIHQPINCFKCLAIFGTMEQLDEYYQDEIMSLIKSGCYSAADIVESMADLDIEPEQLSLFVQTRFTTHTASSQKSKDVVLLQQLFDELCAEGYIALNNAGFTNADAYDLIDEVLSNSKFKPYGYLFYHQQDLFRCIDTGELTISFGAFANTDLTQSNGMTKAQAGSYFKSNLEAKCFAVSWNEDPTQKLNLKNFVFENVYDGQDWSYERCLKILNSK